MESIKKSLIWIGSVLVMAFLFLSAFILMSALVTPRVSAQAVQVYPQDTNISLVQSCYNNGTYCSSTAQCNISVFNPNLVVLVDGANQQMTNQIAFHNFTLNENVTDTIGEYEYRITCTDNSLNNFGTFKFKVTSSGREPALSEAVVYITILLITIILFIFGVWGYTRFEWKAFTTVDGVVKINYGVYTKLLLITGIYLVLTFIAFLGWQISENLVFLDFTTAIIYPIYFGMIAMILPIFAVAFTFAMIIMINNRKLHKSIVRGLPIR